MVLDNADMYACYVLEVRTLEPEFGEPLRRKERALREIWEKRLLAVLPEIGRHEARARVQMAIFSLLALCLHRHRVPRDTLAGAGHHLRARGPPEPESRTHTQPRR